ncbi:MAG: acetyl-CoA carboxylase biotin carboxyl carrier protein [Nitrospinae bacterium]|nr:acetyl-CoA carboxylase biotin carboxyl carrier protein [Nitrospinota bacterium]
MDIKQLKILVNFFEKNKILSELEIEESGVRIKLKRSEPGVDFPPTKEVIALTKRPSIKDDRDKNLVIIESPMVGTFYMAPSPGVDPYVKVGDIVKKGQILCIIEAMKLMNEIESELNGKIVSILVEDGNPVEYGEPLFYIEPL